MTAVAAERIPVRVMVMSAWDTATVQTDPGTTVAQLKRDALRQTRKTAGDEQLYQVKYRGAQILDESIPVHALGIAPNVPFIVLPNRRQPVR